MSFFDDGDDDGGDANDMHTLLVAHSLIYKIDFDSFENFDFESDCNEME